MTRFSNLFFGLLVVVLLLWQVPWAVNYLTAERETTPFTLYSEVLNDFALIRRGNGEIEYADRRNLAEKTMVKTEEAVTFVKSRLKKFAA